MRTSTTSISTYCGYGGVLRRSRSVSLRETAPSAAPGRLRGLERPRRARCGLRRGVEVAPFAPSRCAHGWRGPLATGGGLTAANLRLQELAAGLAVADGEALPFPDNTFDYIFAHVLAGHAAPTMPGWSPSVTACCVLGGTAPFQVYNRISGPTCCSKLLRRHSNTRTPPSCARFDRRVPIARRPVSSVDTVPERFPVKSRLHKVEGHGL